MDAVQTEMDVINMILDAHPTAVKSVSFKDEVTLAPATIVVLEVTIAQYDFIKHEIGYRPPGDSFPDFVLLNADTSTYDKDGKPLPSCILVGVWRGFS